MNKNTIIKIQIVFASLAFICAEISIYLWKPSVITLLLITMVNAASVVAALEFINIKE